MKRIVTFISIFIFFSLFYGTSTLATEFKTEDIRNLKNRIVAGSSQSYIMQHNNTVLGMGLVNENLYPFPQQHRYKNYLTTPTLLLSLGKVKAISEYAAIKEDGSVIYWGATGKPILLGKSQEFIKIVSSYNWVLALTSNGSIFEWTVPSGYSITSNSMRKVLIEPIVDVALNSETVLALSNSGEVYAWGNMTTINSSKNGLTDTPIFSYYNFESIEKPQKLDTLNEKIVDVAFSSDIPVLVTSTGKVLVWIEQKDENHHRFGYKSTYLDTSGVIAAFNNSKLLMKKDGSIWIWGATHSDFESLLISNPNGYSFDPLKTDPVPEFNDLLYFSRDSHFLMITKNGDIKVYGDNDFGQLGLGEIYSSTEFYKVGGIPKVAKISTSNGHAAVLTEDQDIYLWGKNYSHQVNESDINPIIKPEKLKTDLKFSNVFAGEGFTLALGVDNKLYGMGNLKYFFDTENPHESFANHNLEELPYKFEVKELYSGYSGATIIKSDDSVSFIGGYYYNIHGQTPKVTTKERVITNIKGSEIKEVRTSEFHTAVLKKDGTVWTWNNFNEGEQSIQAQQVNIQNIKNVIPLSINGDSYYFAIDEKNQIWTWGNNSGALFYKNLPKYIEHPTKIEIGDNSRKYIDGGGYGNIYFIGKDNYLYSQYGSEVFTLKKVEDLQENNNVNFVLTVDGEIYAQGNNEYGELGLNTRSKYLEPTKLPNFKSFFPLYINNELNLLIFAEVIDGTTYLPMRKMGEILGAEILWNARTSEAILLKDDIELKINIVNKNVFKNGQAIEMLNEPILKDNSTYLPLRFIAEILGVTVQWEESEKAIHLFSKQ